MTVWILTCFPFEQYGCCFFRTIGGGQKVKRSWCHIAHPLFVDQETLQLGNVVRLIVLNKIIHFIQSAFHEQIIHRCFPATIGLIKVHHPFVEIHLQLFGSFVIGCG